MTKERPRYIVVAASEMPTISQKLLVYKAFGVYPPDEEIEFCIPPFEIVADKAYVLDREKIEGFPDNRVMDEDFMDQHFKVGPR